MPANPMFAANTCAAMQGGALQSFILQGSEAAYSSKQRAQEVRKGKIGIKLWQWGLEVAQREQIVNTCEVKKTMCVLGTKYFPVSGVV